MSRLPALCGAMIALAATAHIPVSTAAQGAGGTEVRVAPRSIVLSSLRGGRMGVAIDLGDTPSVPGARIQEVLPGSPAEDAGLRAYDVLTHLDGVSLATPLQDEEAEADLDSGEPLPPQRLIALLDGRDAGDTVRVRYRRDGAEGEVSVVLQESGRILGVPGGTLSIRAPGGGVILDRRGDAPRVLRVDSLVSLRERIAPDVEIRIDSLLSDLGDMRVRTAPRVRILSDSVRALGDARVFEISPELGGAGVIFSSRMRTQGIEVRDLDEQLGAYFGGSNGVLVLGVDEDSTLGLRGGDVILSIDGRDVEDTGDLRRILGSYEEGDTLSIDVRREGQVSAVRGTIR